MLRIVPIFQLVGTLEQMGRVRGCRCRVVRCPLTPAWAGPAHPHVPRTSLEPPTLPPVDGRQGWRMNGLSRAKEGDEWWLLNTGGQLNMRRQTNIYSSSPSPQWKWGWCREQVNICLLATAEVWATWGPRDWGARYCFPREGAGCFICFTFPTDSGCFICLTCLSAFPLLHVSAHPGGQICAMNKIAAKLRMRLQEIYGWKIWNHNKYECKNGKYAMDLNWGWAAEILYIQPSEFALIDWAWEIQIISLHPLHLEIC